MACGRAWIPTSKTCHPALSEQLSSIVSFAVSTVLLRLHYASRHSSRGAGYKECSVVPLLLVTFPNLVERLVIHASIIPVPNEKKCGGPPTLLTRYLQDERSLDGETTIYIWSFLRHPANMMIRWGPAYVAQRSDG